MISGYAMRGTPKGRGRQGGVDMSYPAIPYRNTLWPAEEHDMNLSRVSTDLQVSQRPRGERGSHFFDRSSARVEATVYTFSTTYAKDSSAPCSYDYALLQAYF